MHKADLDRLVAAARYQGPIVTADRLVGLEACLRQLEGQIALFNRPDLATRFGLEPSGTLFVGPAGTGKTHTARYLAGRLNRPLYQVSADEFGADADLLHGLFRRLSQERAILFLDEVSLIGRMRAWAQVEERRMLSALLTSLDGLATAHGPDRLWVIGSCTTDLQLDPALYRSGRLGVVIEFAEPNEAQRRELFRLYLEHVPHQITEAEIAHLATFANEATGADIADWVSQAGSEALADAGGSSDADPVIELRHLEAVVNRRGFVGAPDRAGHEPDWGTAVHEAGHAVIAHDLFGPEAIAKVAVGWGQRPKSLGGSFRGHFELSDEWAAKNPPNSGNWLEHVAVSLAGRCAEEVILRSWGRGAKTDVNHATRAILELLEWGDPTFGPAPANLEEGSFDKDSVTGSERMRRLVWELTRYRLDLGLAWTRALVTTRREAIEQLARVLLEERQTLGADEIGALVGKPPLVDRPDAGRVESGRSEFGSLKAHPDCTHREITAYFASESGEPMPFWSCRSCGRHFAPTLASA